MLRCGAPVTLHGECALGLRYDRVFATIPPPDAPGEVYIVATGPGVTRVFQVRGRGAVVVGGRRSGRSQTNAGRRGWRPG